MACNRKLTADILFDCADFPKAGLDSGKAVIINTEDIDWTASTATGATITALTLKTGTSGFSVEWYKELASTASTFNLNTEDIDGFGHSFLTRLSNTSADNAERANELKMGRFIVVVETNYKGASNAEAFKVYGWDSGLILSEMTSNSNENSGSTLFTLSTKENTVEQYPYNILMETDYDTTKADFEALFAAP